MTRAPLIAALVLIAGLLGIAVPAAASAASNGSGRPAVTSVSPAGGPVGGGTTLTIHGARFSGVESVTIGGKRARGIHVRSSTMLTVVDPAHAAGSAAIVITEKTGTSTGTVRFRYLSAPRLAGLSAHSGPVTGGQVVVVAGSNFSYVTAVLFGTQRATVLPGSTSTRLRVRTPVSWAAAVEVTVHTLGGATGRSGKPGLFVFQNPARRIAGELAPAAGDVIATDVTAVSGGPAIGARSAPWTVTLGAAATMPAVGQEFLLKPGGSVYPGGLAGTVTAADPAAGTVTVTPGTLGAAVQTVKVAFSGPLGDANAAARALPAGGPSLTSEIDFGSISASELACHGFGGKSVKVTGSFSLTLQDVEAHLEVDAGSLFTKPFVDAWITYEPTMAFSVQAEDEASCSLPPEWQNAHEKLFFLGDTGATIAIAPDASFTVSAGGAVSFSQHSYQFLGFVSNPDGSISRRSGQSSDPAQVKVSGELKAEAYGGVQIQIGELNVIGLDMSIGGGVAGTATSDWPPQVCLSAYPYLRGTLYAYLSAWVKVWKLQSFQVELDFSGISSCAGTGWHVAWQSGSANLVALNCPAASECLAVGSKSGHGLILRTTDGGQAWQATTMTGYASLGSVACADVSHCVAAAIGSTKLAVSSNGGASWSTAGLPSAGTPLVGIDALACAAGGTCYAIASMKNYSNSVIYGSGNSGRTWTELSEPDASFSAMTCVNSASCVAVGSVPPTYGSIVWPAASFSTRNGWLSSTASYPAHWDSLTSVACASVSLCYAPGLDTTSATNNVLTSTNFGKSWTKVPVPLQSPWSVSCPGAATCVAGGSDPNWAQHVITTYDDGHSWTKTTISDFPAADSMNAYSLDCPSLGHCVAIEYGTGPTAIVVS